MCALLILAAFPPELAPLREVLGDELRRPFGGQDVAAATVGVGLATSAVGAAMRLASFKPRGVVLVGTCGVYAGDGRVAVGGVAVGGRIAVADGAAARGEAAYPGPMTRELASHGPMSEGLVAHGGRRSDVATTLGVTTNDVTAAAIASWASCEVEHLEAFGVASACEAARVPFASALGVANRVGAAARDEWLQNHHAASRAAIDVLVSWMAAGAPGLPG